MSDIISVVLLIAYLALITLSVAMIGRALSRQCPPKRPAQPARVVYQGRTGYFNDPS